MLISGSSVPRLGRFLVVGLSGTVVNLGILALLATLGLASLPAAVIATELAIINNFIWNDLWTFKGQGRLTWPARFLRFQLVASLTALTSLGLFILFNVGLHLFYLLAQLIAIGLATALNFSVNSKLTWGTLVPVKAELTLAGINQIEEEEC